MKWWRRLRRRSRRSVQVECLLALYDPKLWPVRQTLPNGYAEPWCDQ